MKKIIRLTESDLRKIIKRVINEQRIYPDDRDKLFAMVASEPKREVIDLRVQLLSTQSITIMGGTQIMIVSDKIRQNAFFGNNIYK